MKRLRRILKSEAGQVLPVALVLLALGAFLVVPVVSLMTTNLNANRQVDQASLEQYAADAGVEDVMWHVRWESGFALPLAGQTHNFANIPAINGTTVTTSLSLPAAGQPYLITSTATSPDGHRTTILCTLDITGSSDLWDFALASLGGDIVLTGNSDVDADEVDNGNIYSNGDISVSGNADVHGDASAVGDITTSANGDISGSEVEGASPLFPVLIDTNAYKSQAQNIGCETITCTGGSCPSNWCQTFGSPISCGSGTQTISGCSPIFNASLCIAGDLTIQSNSAGPTFNQPVTITGTLRIQPNNSSSVPVTFNNTLCVGGSIIISSNCPHVYFNGPVYVGGDINQSGNTGMAFGSTCFVGGSFIISGNTDIPLGDTLYVVGSISITGNADLLGGTHIFAETGNIQLAGNSELNAADLPFIMAVTGNVSLTGNNTCSAVIYAPEGSITLGGNSHLIGCAVGESVIGSGNSTVEYLMDLRDRSDLPGRGESGPGTGITTDIQTYSIQ
ncbi:MAG TPA: hypothetical protein VF366_00320 [Dehalococcoidia bacterium]|jgi:cytoskeletal protein CcmA (bactofilin family)